jgi:hypothetical protein
MTLGNSPSCSSVSGGPRTRLVSSQEPSFPDANESPDEPRSGSRKRLRPNTAFLTRQVSNEGLSSASDSEKENGTTKVGAAGRASPIRCVSEFDKVANVSIPDAEKTEHEVSKPRNVPPFPNPLHNAKFFAQHACALQLEAELHPMRLILSRLMAHPSLNRKGIFNAPVDPVALGLPDYFTVISRPMDLGTVKTRLHAVSYASRKHVADDIRLVFQNAMKYNPPQNKVHTCARELCEFFEDQVRAFVPDVAVTLAQSCNDITIVSGQNKGLPNGSSNVAASGSSSSCTTERVIESLSAAEVQGPSAGLYSPPECTAMPLEQSQATHPGQVDGVFPTGPMTGRKRKKRGAKTNPSHSCQWCEGRICSICAHGCLQLEPTLLICSGPSCAGARIRKGATYYIAADGSRQFCQRCYAGLPAILSNLQDDSECHYKRDLLKRKSDEEFVESWLRCTRCDNAVHQVCAMHNEFVHPDEEYSCPECITVDEEKPPSSAHDRPLVDTPTMYTFITGKENPVKLTDFMDSALPSTEALLSSETLPETSVSSFIQLKVRERMALLGCDNADRTVTVRVISDCSRFFKVPDVVRRHFRMQTELSDRVLAAPPTKVCYRSKSIALFQKVDGLDVCIFCMYVQEYEGNDTYEPEDAERLPLSKKRVYVAYLDSVEHFRPRPCRTSVYQEILVAYLASARYRGYESGHIWACPPSRGNSFVFWNHPSSQRTPSRERLIAWYNGALSRAIECGVVTDVQSLYESDFQRYMSEFESEKDSNLADRMVCPPLFDGDFWIEEAVRVHGAAINRLMKIKGSDSESNSSGLVGDAACPARQVAALLRDRVMSHSSSFPFLRPVNAAALDLKDYHIIITKPMDLGTVYSRCLLGEYATLNDLVSDVELVASNAKRYNPEGHFVHSKAEEMRSLFFGELKKLAAHWGFASKPTRDVYPAVSLSLDNTVDSLSLTLLSSPVHRILARSPSLSSNIFNGPGAILERMVGEDKWMLDKKGPNTNKGGDTSKRLPSNRRKNAESDEEPAPRRRRQGWLGDEVGAAVRRMRTSFFTCSLRECNTSFAPSINSSENFKTYTRDITNDLCPIDLSSAIVDSRHGLLEFSQYRNLEFDTLRRAKYSTSVLLYHLHHNNAPGTTPSCTSCHENIEDVRWHKIRKVVETKRVVRRPPACRKPVSVEAFAPEELCTTCYLQHVNKHLFIPLQVSLRQP